MTIIFNCVRAGGEFTPQMTMVKATYSFEFTSLSPKGAREEEFLVLAQLSQLRTILSKI